MTYDECLTYLYDRLPMFQRVGKRAYKVDLTNTIRLLEALENPHKKFKSVHIAGTNGKGSSAHGIASILIAAGYKTGLYTSPHLKDFTERIRINGKEINKKYVVDFVEKIKTKIEEIQPSFFEVTVAMAFQFFADEEVDIAVIETGLGGRLDSTNVIVPEVSLITKIGFDHMDILGDTLEKIASEKAGIIKKNVPIAISEKQEEIKNVFIAKADLEAATIFFAEDLFAAEKKGERIEIKYQGSLYAEIRPDIKANYFIKNLPGILKTIEVLKQKGWKINREAIESGLGSVVSRTGIKGRYQVLQNNPKIIADVSHNVDGISTLLKQIEEESYSKLLVIYSTVSDKDVRSILKLFPETSFYFVETSVPRKMPLDELISIGKNLQLKMKDYPNVNIALEQAKKDASKNDLILITGSNFVVAEINGL